MVIQSTFTVPPELNGLRLNPLEPQTLSPGEQELQSVTKRTESHSQSDSYQPSTSLSQDEQREKKHIYLPRTLRSHGRRLVRRISTQSLAIVKAVQKPLELPATVPGRPGMRRMPAFSTLPGDRDARLSWAGSVGRQGSSESGWTQTPSVRSPHGFDLSQSSKRHLGQALHQDLERAIDTPRRAQQNDSSLQPTSPKRSVQEEPSTKHRMQGERQVCDLCQVTDTIIGPTEHEIPSFQAVQQELHPRAETTPSSVGGFRRLRARESLRNLTKLVKGNAPKEQEADMYEAELVDHGNVTAHQANIGRRRTRRE